MAFAWLLGLALTGCNSCCHDWHETQTIFVTDEQLAHGITPATCRELCTAARSGADAAALPPDVDADVRFGDPFASEVTCTRGGNQLTCDWLMQCPPQ